MTSASPKPKDHLWLAIGFASINAAMLGGMSLFSKLLSQYYGPLEVTFFRNFVSLIALVLIFGAMGHIKDLISTKRPWAHAFRSAIGTAGIVLGMWALSLMPLAETTILLFTSPLFTVLLSMLVLKERVGLFRLGAVAVGFLGVVIVANPFAEGGLHLPLLGLCVGLGWGFFSGSVDTCLRWIGATEKSATTTFYFMLYGSIATALHWPFADIQPGAFELPVLGIIIGLAGCGLLSLLAKSQSFRLGEATLVAPFMYTMILWSALFDYLFWDRLPSLNLIAGGTIIIAANLFILYREIKVKGLSETPATPTTDS